MAQKEKEKASGIRAFAAWVLRKLTYKQFLVVGALVVGLWAGLTAVALKSGVHWIEELIQDVDGSYNWIFLLTPIIGIAISFLLEWIIFRDRLPKGTAHVLMSIARKSSRIPPRETYGHAITSATTVGLGGSAGLESPIVQTGAAIGSTFASIFPIGYRERTLLLACGAASGIAAVFNAPIAGVLFALEVLLVDVSITAFIPLLIAGAVGALCSEIVLSEEILFSFRQVAPFDYHHIFYYVMLGVLSGAVAAYYIQTFVKVEKFLAKSRSSMLARMLIGGFLLTVLIAFFPPLFGEGYTAVKSLANLRPELLLAESPVKDWLTYSAWTIGISILVLGLVKVFAVSLTLGAGGNGGNFAPALVVGACVGFTYSYLIDASGVAQLPLANFCLAGMAGVLTGIFHSPLTAIFLIAEITGGYSLIVPLMIVSALSTGISKYFQLKSLDEEKMMYNNQAVSLDKDAALLSDLSLRRTLETDFVTIPPDAYLRQLVAAVARSKRNIFPVVDAELKLKGIILLEDIREVMFDARQYDTLRVDTLMHDAPVTCNVTDDMSVVMEKFDQSGAWNIPILENGKYLGFISKSRVLSSYRAKLKEEE